MCCLCAAAPCQADQDLSKSHVPQLGSTHCFIEPYMQNYLSAGARDWLGSRLELTIS